MKISLVTALPVSLLHGVVGAIDVQVNDDKSLKQAASTIADGMIKYYTGWRPGDVPGNLPDPYPWWEAGAMFGTLIDYWHLTGDDKYNNMTTQAMVHQASDTRDFMPPNQTLSEANDDQGFWAMASMSAAENVFPDPPPDQPQWLALTQAVFNQYVSRWDAKTCDGGLRWQLIPSKVGSDYKNAISNGCFFNIATRLAKYTDNSTYADWANKVWDWTEKKNVITKTYQVFDGVRIIKEVECNEIDKTQWSYNTAIYLHGAAVMYNYTGKDIWKTRVDGLLKNALNTFTKGGVPYEQQCEGQGGKGCNLDQQSFKGYFVRWLAGTTQLAPHTADSIRPLLQDTAKAAASNCIGSPASGFSGKAGTACGFSWVLKGQFDGLFGLCEQMSALSAMIYPLSAKAKGPATNKTGGTSTSDPGAGNPDSDKPQDRQARKITTADKAGAAVVTILMSVVFLGGFVYIVM